jgi:hypothetical protein
MSDDPMDSGEGDERVVYIDQYQERFEKLVEDDQRHGEEIEGLRLALQTTRSELLTQQFQSTQRQLNVERELCLLMVLEQARWALTWLGQLQNPQAWDTTFPTRLAACQYDGPVKLDS